MKQKTTSGKTSSKMFSNLWLVFSLLFPPRQKTLIAGIGNKSIYNTIYSAFKSLNNNFCATAVLVPVKRINGIELLRNSTKRIS